MFKCAQNNLQWHISAFRLVVCAYALFTFVCTQSAFAQEAQHSAKDQLKSIAHAHKYTTQSKLYCLPITLATFVPVSIDTIKRKADKVIPLNIYNLTIFYRIISGKPGLGILDANSLSRLVRDKKRTKIFDNSNVRLCLDDGNQASLFIDQQGVVLYNHKEYSLTPLAFVQLDHFVASLPNHKIR